MKFGSIVTSFAIGAIAVAIGFAQSTTSHQATLPLTQVELDGSRLSNIIRSLENNALFGPGFVLRPKGATGTVIYNMWDVNGAGFNAQRLTVINLGDSTVTILQAGKSIVVPPGDSVGVLISNNGNDGLVGYSIGTDGSSAVPNGQFVWVLR